MISLSRFLIAAALLAAPQPLLAGQVDLLLEIDFAGPSSAFGGSWRLLANADEQGLFSLRVPLRGIDGPVSPRLPIGLVNNSFSVNAGFATFVETSQPGFRDLFFGQQNTPIGQGEQGVFYGVGTLVNGAPSFGGTPVGANTLGPTITTLQSVLGLPWGNEANLPAGVEVAVGTFAPGQIPEFSPTGPFQASLFTTIGDLTEPGLTTSDVTFSTEVIDDLTFGVATGDYNGDGRVDAADYAVFRNSLGQTVSALSGADGDGDGVITDNDFLIWERNFGRVQPGSLALAAIPEPSSAVILGCLLAAGCGRWRRSRAIGAAN